MTATTNQQQQEDEEEEEAPEEEDGDGDARMEEARCDHEEGLDGSSCDDIGGPSTSSLSPPHAQPLSSSTTTTTTKASSSPTSSSEDVAEETSSTGGSTSEGKSGSGGSGFGGGYAADCSSASSDQSSEDDNGGRQEGSANVGDPKVGMASINPEDDDGPRTNPMGAGAGAGAGSSSSSEETEGEDHAPTSHKRQGGLHRRPSTTINNPNHNHNHGTLVTKGETQQPSGKRAARRKRNLALPHDNATAEDDDGDEDDEEEEEEEASESELAQLKEKLDQVALDMKYLPQWNGVRIQHPMDPRIDLSNVKWRSDIPVGGGGGGAAAVGGGTLLPSATAASPAMPGATPGAVAQGTSAAPGDEGAETLEHYQRLMEVVRPYFQAHGIPYHAEQPQQSQKNHRAESDEAHGSGSSEGFTSFFTTTHTSGGSTNGGNSQSSDNNNNNNHNHNNKNDATTKPKAKSAPMPPPLAPSAALPQPKAPDGDEASDTSSMIVLARAKRKHQNQHPQPNQQEQDGAGGEGGDTNDSSRSSSSQEQRHVRIHHQPADEHALPHHNAAPPLNPPEAVLPQPRHPAHDEAAVAAAAAEEEPQESSMSSTSSSEPPNAHHHPARHFGVPPHFVTDVSSSNRTDSTGSNLNSASGSGSGGNTGSGTGSGSNRGSSGSGNDGKGSSEDVALEDRSGDGTNEGSDEAEESKLGLGLHPGAGAQEKKESVRERKLQDKKRKRIVKRREYEAQQQSESSENNDNSGESLFRPGKPVTMDQVLQFSKIPRLVVLSTPPFLVVHTNAAYCRLTGIDSHKVVGKPIRALLSVPEEGLSAMQGFQDESSEAAAGNNSELAAAAAAGRARASQQNRQSVELERMVASSGFGHLHTLRVHAKQHHLVGKNVSFIPDGTPRVAAAAAANAGVRDEGSHDTSLTGSFEGHPFIRCQTSVAPVVSSVTCLESMVVSDREGSIHQKAKRRKLHGAPEAEAQRKPHAHAPKESTTSHRKHALPLRTTHFIIQLQPLVSGKQGSEESLSSNSTSVEARLLGISKAELLAQRQTVHTSKANLHESDALQADDDAAASESTGTREPVSTVG